MLRWCEGQKSLGCDLRLERGSDSLLIEVGPVDRVEEWVRFHRPTTLRLTILVFKRSNLHQQLWAEKSKTTKSYSNFLCTIKFYKKKRSSLCILRPTTQTVSWGLDQELGEEVLRLAADRLREPHVLHQDQLEQDVVVSVKQKLSYDKTISMMEIKVFQLACCRRVTRYY